MRVFRELWGSNSTLRRVGASWFLINLAEWAYVTALLISNYRTDGALAVGLLGARFIPAAVSGSLLVGVLGRYDSIGVLRLLSASRAGAVLVAGVVVEAHGPLAILVAIVWIDAVIGAPYRPVLASVLPALSTTPRELSAVAGTVPSSKALAQAMGALGGSLALEAAAPQAIVFAAAGVFLLISVLVAPLRRAAVVVPPAGAGSRHGRYGAILVGFQQIAGRARPLLVLGGARSFTRGLWTTLGVLVAIQLLGIGSGGVGALMAAAGVGAAVAVPASIAFAGRPRLAGPAAVCFAWAGIPIVLVGLVPRPGPAIALMVGFGLAFALSDSISNALVHRTVDARQLSPSVAAIESSKLLLEGLGALSAPALIAVFGVRASVILTGALLPAMVAVSRGQLVAVDRRAEAHTRPLAALRRVPSFRGLSMLALETLAARLQHAEAPAGTEIIRQGDVGDRFYLIDSGRVEVTVDGFRVSLLGPGGSFGERALLRSTNRSAGVTALEPSRLWSLVGQDFLAAALGEEGPVAQRIERAGPESLEDVLDGVPLFGAIDRRELAAAGELITAGPGHTVVTQGDPGGAFYVILEGAAAVTIDGKPVGTLAPGDWFGEIALLHSVPRTATVTTTTGSKLWSLGREAFLATLGDGAPPDGAAGAAGAAAVPGAGLIV